MVRASSAKARPDQFVAAFYRDGIRTEVWLDQEALAAGIQHLARRAIAKARQSQTTRFSTAAAGVLVFISHPSTGIPSGPATYPDRLQ
jgi:hypothetical protein